MFGATGGYLLMSVFGGGVFSAGSCRQFAGGYFSETSDLSPAEAASFDACGRGLLRANTLNGEYIYFCVRKKLEYRMLGPAEGG